MIAQDRFAAAYGVSGPSLAALSRYAVVLADWQTRMNLVAASTLDNVWERHFADSAQLAAVADAGPGTIWLDIGSGAGFPALVLAVLAPGTFHLVEATGKKCAFLAAAAADLGVAGKVIIHHARIEALQSFDADIITARACAPLKQLFAWGLPFARQGRWLLLKGRSAATEIAAAEDDFSFAYRLVASRTDADARIIDAHDVRRKR